MLSHLAYPVQAPSVTFIAKMIACNAVLMWVESLGVCQKQRIGRHDKTR